MIDLGAAYVELARILHRHGLRASYALTIAVWHHELGEEPAPPADVSFTASIIHGARCIQSQGPTLAAVLTGVEAELVTYLAARGAVTPPDLQVAL